MGFYGSQHRSILRAILGLETTMLARGRQAETDGLLQRLVRLDMSLMRNAFPYSAGECESAPRSAFALSSSHGSAAAAWDTHLC
jgi:hypothetical protein